MAGLDTKEARMVFLSHSYLWGESLLHPIDDSRFWNHSGTPNTGPSPDNAGLHTIALRDICPGEELFDDYSTYGACTWYDELYEKYGVPTPRAVAASSKQT